MSVKEETEDEDFEELIKEVEKLENSYYFLKNEKTDWLKEKERLKKEKHKLVIEKEILNDQLNASQKQMHELENSYHF
ncbi:hypothetical protein [Helicobacter pylori]|uniref:hypothetical protein n=1 Tax=Helicobacter pylori TaxID=210 RepID=UPI001F0CD7F1|nr:hypothetical protein [Helicobacter pylori]MCQ2627125.1 hypothetical protein [Helicobacter pylori]